MSSRFDEIFSPERLRRNWDRARETPASLHCDLPGLPDAAREHARLLRLLSERFSGEALVALTVLTDELGEGLRARFPGGWVDEPSLPESAADKEPSGGGRNEAVSPSGGPGAGEGSGAGDMEIHGLIDRIEDLVEALELGKAGQTG